MKAQCEKCRETVELSFAPASGGIDVACPACGARYFVASEPVAPPTPPAEPPRPRAGEQECPKCGLVQPCAEACRRCGLVFVRWKGSAADADGEASALWAACEADWNEGSRHDAFIAYCQRTAQFPYAAGRYRAAQTSRGAAAEPTATRALDRIEKLAITALELSARRAASEPTRMPYKNAAALLALALFLLVGGLVWAIFYQQSSARRQDQPDDHVVPVLPSMKKR